MLTMEIEPCPANASRAFFLYPELWFRKPGHREKEGGGLEKEGALNKYRVFRDVASEGFRAICKLLSQHSLAKS